MVAGLVLFTNRTVRSDMCQDVCLRELGSEGCPKGSWCKNNNDCQSLFYTSADGSSICVFTGWGSCTNKYPVLCADARARTQGGLGATRAPTVPPVLPPKAPIDVKPQTMKRTITTTSTKAPELAPATVGSRVSLGRDMHQKAKPTTLVLHYNGLEYDPCPRTTMSFIANGQDIGFSVNFDTGSATSHILEMKGTPEEVAALATAPPSYLPIDGIDPTMEPVKRPAKRGEGYLNVGLVQRTGEARKIYYGTEDALRAVSTSGRINEFAFLYSGKETYAFEIEIELREQVDNHFTGIGLLGAGRTSHLALTAGIFSYLGPIVDYRDRASGTAGSVMIGERDLSILNSHCLGGQQLQFYPTRPQISQIHWVVGGSVIMNNVVGAETLMEETNWIVDTGAHRVFVSTEMMNAVKQAMLYNGAVLVSEKPGHLTKYRKCPPAELMPSFTFYLGTGAKAVAVVLTAREYLRRVDISPGACFLEVSDSRARQSARLIGIRVLSKMLTVFDAENDRMGFCNSRL